MKANFELMASYNQRMNKALYEVAATLNNEELHQDRGAFFHSIMGTLNHILVGDIIWLKRFACHKIALPSLEAVTVLKTPRSLDATLCSSLTELTVQRLYLDGIIVQFTAQLTEQAMATPLAYNNSKGLPFNKNFGHLLQHFFNHQTHHRGQISTLLYQAGVDVGVTDLLLAIPNE